MRHLLGFLFFFLFPFFGWTLDPERTAALRIASHLILGDYDLAVKEATAAYALFPTSLPIRESYLRALSRAGEEKKMLSLWKEQEARGLDETTTRRLLEIMAWGVIDKAYLSASPLIRLHALIAGLISEDVRGVDLLLKGLQEKELLLRIAAVELAGQFRDDRLKEAIRHLVKEESVQEIQCAAITAAGKMEIRDLEETLLAFLSDENTDAEVQRAAAEALALMIDRLAPDDIARLARSSRSGLRTLACLVIGHCELYESVPELIRLSEDSHGDVRVAALHTLGLFYPIDGAASLISLLQRLAYHSHPMTGISAAWLLTLYDWEKGIEAFAHWFSHEDRDVRLMAAAALPMTGEKGWPLGKKILQSSEDLTLRINLIVGFLPFRNDTAWLSRELFHALEAHEERLGKRQLGALTLIVPLQRVQRLGVASPEEVNQLTRLELLALLTLFDPALAERAFYDFLFRHQWNLSRFAATLLLTEGDEEAMATVERLLNHESVKIRFEAALILALWGREPKVLRQLQETYPLVDRQGKEKILLAMGHVGDLSLAPFLLDCLAEPHQSLRILAATSLLQCLKN